MKVTINLKVITKYIFFKCIHISDVATLKLKHICLHLKHFYLDANVLGSVVTKMLLQKVKLLLCRDRTVGHRCLNVCA